MSSTDCTFADNNDDSALANGPWLNAQVQNDNEQCLSRVKDFVRFNCWEMCRSLGESKRPQIIAELGKFNFCHLVKAARYDDKIFSGFLVWLVQYTVCSPFPPSRICKKNKNKS
jgi:hypothetical protein